MQDLKYKKVYLIFGVIGTVSFLLAALLYYLFAWQKPVSFETFASLKNNELSNKDYRAIVDLHSECFDPDKRTYLYRYMTEVNYPEIEEILKHKLKEEIDLVVAKGHQEKLANFKNTENLTVLRHDHRIIGMYNCRPDNAITQASIMIFNVCIATSERGKGYGEKLMRHAIANCQQERRPLTLTVYKDNLAAIKLYEKLNFTIIPVEKQPDDEFMIFQKHLMQYKGNP